jgi:hypothetical protein
VHPWTRASPRATARVALVSRARQRPLRFAGVETFIGRTFPERELFRQYHWLAALVPDIPPMEGYGKDD